MPEKRLHLIAPTKSVCVIGSCPAVYSASRSIIVVGRLLPASQLEGSVRARIGPDEAAIEIPLSIWEEAVAAARSKHETGSK